MDVDDQQGNWHDDFTTASQWEMFIARIEEAIYDWKLPQLKAEDHRFRKSSHQVDGKLEYAETNLQFSDTDFILRYFYRNPPEQDNSNSPGPEDKGDRQWGHELIESDILDEDGEKEVNGVHPIELWYGVSRFVLLSPAQNYAAITSESKAKLLLSSAKIAISNSKCPIPIFVQVHQPQQRYFLGTWQGPGMQTDFTMVHLRQAPKHCKYLTGLLDIFKGKLAAVAHSPAHALATPIEISARIHFVLKDWPMNQWMQSPPDFELLHGQVGVEHIGKLPFGAEADPLRELHLLAQWRRLPEGVLVDRDGYSDLAPSMASRWSLQAHMAPPSLGLLAKSLGRLLNLCSSTATLKQLLGDMVMCAPEASISYTDSLSALTEPKVPSLSKLVPSSLKSGSSNQGTSMAGGPIPHQMLMTILYYLFPDADVNGPANPYPETFGQDEPKSSNFREKGSVQYKSCPVDCLVWRLAIVTALVADASHGGLRAAAHLWHEVNQEMRYRWDHAITIPGLVPGCPDLRSCILYQKLQMLNYCIQRRQDRERKARSQADSDNEFEDVSGASSEEEEDKFYECDDDEAEAPKKKEKHSLWDKPEGRLSKDGSLLLIESKEPLYIPITQEPPPKTEDQRHEDAEVLMMLGDDAQGSELRAQIMSPLLLSDMESFKAANPGSCLGDFVRWYSPRDWIEEENKLSPRMLIEGNTWQELWSAAKPVPAGRQKRLFDDTKEAEKVMYYLESQKPADAFQMLLPTLLHASMCRLGEEWLEDLTPISAYNSLQEKASRLSMGMTPKHKEYSRFVDLINAEEMKVVQFNSIEEKFQDESFADRASDLKKFLCDLLRQKEVEVPDGPTGVFGQKLRNMFLQAQKAAHLIPDELNEKSNQPQAFPAPSEREFLLRVKACVPSPASTPSPQRIYAVVKDQSLRLAGAFSHDTVFF
ncbi:rab3 GTPase-activating protein catalytic subunit [Neocloeon triangulifer]|uniref:rab3 GTPase-activating protein catalytic subunit n=1 Tax=Neocloeon triangulifer TaxID=2078957 RepID=UPI00286F5B82|nr:rab3 GTPase-activating protein catalytic subunit [Neocloeon triangulifer]